MADIITRLLLDTKNFDAKLDRSKSSVNSFQGGISNMAKTAGAGVLKFAGTLGLAVGAGEAFNKIMSSSQTTGDAWASVIGSAKASVDEFFTSLSTGDFTGFLGGLDDIISKAKDAISSLDQLGNTRMSYQVFSGKYATELESARVVAQDKGGSIYGRQKGFDKWNDVLSKQEKDVNVMKETVLDALRKTVVQGTRLNSKNVSIDDFEDIMHYDLSDVNTRDKLKSSSKRGYEEYTRRYEALEKRKKSGGVADWAFPDSNDAKERETHNAKISALQEELNAEYKQSILYNQLLVRWEDEKLQSAVKLHAEYENTERIIPMQRRTYNMAYNRFRKEKGEDTGEMEDGNDSSSSNRKGKPTTPSPAGSIAALNEQIVTKNKELLNATTVQARAEIQKTIDELEARKISLNISTEKEVFRNKYGENKLDATKAQKQFSEYINVDKEISAKSKELTNATTEQARVAVQKTISELEEKKIRLKVSIEKEIQTNSVDSKTKKDFTEYISVEEDIAKQNTQLINSTTEQARTAVQSTINELEARKIQISANISLKPDLSSEMVGVLNNGSIDRKGKQVTKGSNATDISKIKLPKYEPIFKKEDIDLNNDFADSLSGIGDMMGSLSSLFDENTASALQWGSTLLMAIAQATPAILGMMGVKEQDTATTNANTTAEVANAGAKAMSAHSGIPFVGIALGLAGVAAIIAAMSSMPHFATGGIVPGTSFTGDKVPALLNSGEMILNGAQQGNLFKILNGGMYDSLSRTISPLPENSEIRLSSNITVRGDTLYLALNNYMKRTGKKL